MASPLNMSQDLPALSPEDRILQLECTIDEMKSQDDMTKTLLHDILDQLGLLASNACRPMQDQAPSNPQTQTPLVMTTSTSAGWKKPASKPSSLADFDGDWTKGEAFLISCWTYIWLCANSFEDDATKIVWAM